MISMNLYQKIQKCKQKGYLKSEINRELNLSPKTIRKYYNMPEPEYRQYVERLKYREKVFEDYNAEILSIYEQNNYCHLPISAIYDYLEEKNGELPGTEKSLRNYIHYLTEVGELLIQKRKRIYIKVPELPYGKQLQIDFGEYKTISGLKVYLFAAILSSSRYKYVAAQDKPFTTLDLIQHLLDCFTYIGGRPEELVIDQDRTMVVSENRGDIIYTRDFLYFIEEMNLQMYVCRKNDPESKGKVENVIKYVKRNFFATRDFKYIEDVQEGLRSWLKRRGNGKISLATKCIPAELHKEEKKYLQPIKASIYQKNSLLDREIRDVDDKSRISVDASRYSVPENYRNRTVEIYKTETKIFLFDPRTGQQIGEHNRALLPNQTIINRDHYRSKSTKPAALKEKLLLYYTWPEWQAFVEKNYRKYIRYFRDQYREAANRFAGEVDEEQLKLAVRHCLETKTYSIGNLYDAYSYFKNLASGELKEDLLEEIKPQLKKIVAIRREVRVAQRPLSVYKTLFNLVMAVIL